MHWYKKAADPFAFGDPSEKPPVSEIGPAQHKPLPPPPKAAPTSPLTVQRGPTGPWAQDARIAALRTVLDEMMAGRISGAKLEQILSFITELGPSSLTPEELEQFSGEGAARSQRQHSLQQGRERAHPTQ